ncbi:hypothetical protein Rhe02_38510 [Rhizocola hellebori]|uniref:Uncharacterized protein n=1 Tax=Rhizocola hellebori TaxID=1392758 RepID=A0A8J3VFY3_9ACTN|nr:hypothetical protein [Rhizocola hellebori]GIH05784.1 hypothetical protein Rhe02_38510 [Rhizocola hellebori]
MNAVFLEFLHGLMQAAAIWLALLAVAVIALSVMVRRPAKRERLPEEQRVRGALLKRARLTAQYEELNRFADEVSVAAQRAAATADRRRAEWLAAQGRVQIAWEAYTACDDQARRLTAAAAIPAPRTPSTPAEYAERERFLHRAAMAACSHRQLSPLDLSDALAHRNGWDPRRHPVEQEMVLRRVARDGLLETYHAAAQQESAAWQVANTATVAARSLREEAYLAADRARQAKRVARPGRPANRTDTRPQWSVQSTVGMRLIARPTR